jgi:cell division protein FtsQ
MNLNINIPKKIQHALMVVLTLGLGVLLVSSRSYKKSIKPADFKIEIETLEEGKNLLTETEVLSHLQSTLQYNPVKLTVGDTRLQRFEEVIQQIPYVKEADVYLDHNAVLHFKLSQRKPVLRMVNSGKSRYIDATASLIPLSKHYTIRVPMLHGFIPPMDEEWEEELKGIVNAFEQSDQWSLQIDQIYRKQDGSYVLIPVLSDMKIDFGPWKDVDEKLEKLDQFFDEVLPVKGWSKYERIDLRYKDQVIAKMKV